MAMGGILNILLDPIFIFPLGFEIAGAAIATMLSNAAATAYFLILILKKGRETDIALHPGHYTLTRGIPREVLLVGLPSCLMNLMGVLSNITINRLMSGYSMRRWPGSAWRRRWICFPMPLRPPACPRACCR